MEFVDLDEMPKAQMQVMYGFSLCPKKEGPVWHNHAWSDGL